MYDGLLCPSEGLCPQSIFFSLLSKEQKVCAAAGISFWYLVFFLQDENMNFCCLFFFFNVYAVAYIQATNYLLVVA